VTEEEQQQQQQQQEGRKATTHATPRHIHAALLRDTHACTHAASLLGNSRLLSILS
jgi:hypothetical protein